MSIVAKLINLALMAISFVQYPKIFNADPPDC